MTQCPNDQKQMNKKILLLIITLAGIIGIAATTHDYFLLPENFFMHKGDKLNLHLIGGDEFTKKEEVRYQPGKTTSFMLYNGSKKIDLIKMAKDSAAPVLSYTVENSGQTLLEMTRSVELNSASRDNFSEYLTNLNYDKLGEAVKTGNQFRLKEKYTRYMKTLIAVDNNDGSVYGKILNEEYEIVLKDNPFNKKYGDDLTALIRFKGKPVKGAQMAVYIKSPKGNVYTQLLVTGANGEATFTMSREGIYLIRSVRVEQTKDKDADYETWWASYTFPFSSSDDLPNTYKEFGFGDKH
jgi:uncharacterized GH25 family protein